MYLQKCFELIEQHFPQDWLSSINVEEEAGLPTPFFDLYTNLNIFSNDFFRLLNLSVIKGEYVGVTQFEEKLEHLNVALDKIVTIIGQEDLEDEKFNQISNIIINELIQPIVNSLTYYKQLYKNIHERLKRPNRSIIIETFEKNYSTLYQTINLETISSRDFFTRYNIELARIDHNIKVNKDTLSKLLFIHANLKKSESETDVIKKILFYKSNYLILKILARNKKNRENLSFSVDFKVRNVEAEEFNCGPYVDFINNMHLHYSDETEYEHHGGFDDKVRSLMQEYEAKQLTTFESFHAFVKYYKDSNVDEKKLIQIIEQFSLNQNHSKIDTNIFNKRAYQITLNYLHNNLISFYLDHTIQNNNGINHKIEAIRSLQNDTEVRNYFPYKKVCEYLLKSIEIQFDKGTDINFPTIEEKLNSLDEYSAILEKNFEWSYNKNFIAFQSSYEECLSTGEIDGENFTVFSNSSLVLPIDYNRERKEVKNIITEKQKFRILYDIRKEVYSDKESIDRIKNDFLNADKKNIEILSIFAAIVLFVASDIQLFTKVSSINDALRFMLVFGYIMGLFVILIWLVTRENKFEEKKIPFIHQVVIGIWALATICAFIVTYPFKANASESATTTIKELKSQKDSINRVVDSLNKAYNRSTVGSDSLKPDTLKNK